MPPPSASAPTRSMRVTVRWVVALSGLWLVVGQIALWRWVPDPALSRPLELGGHVLYLLLMSYLLRDVLGRYWQRKSAVATGQRAQQLLQSLARSSPDAIYAKAQDGRFLLANPEAGRLMQHPPEALIGRDDTLLFPPEQRQALRANDLQVMAQQQPQSFEETLDTADGLRTFESIKGPLLDDQGHVIGLFGISRDITKALAANRRLQASEQRYRALFDDSPLPMSVFHRETLRLLAVNQAALNQYGYSRDELLTMTLYDIRPPEDQARLRDNLARHGAPTAEALGGGQRWRHLRKDGSVMLVEVSVSQIEFDGQPACIGLINDVTRQVALEEERQQAQDALQRSRDLLHSTLARVDDGFVAFDTDWVYTYVNLRAAHLLGREKPQDLLGRHIWTEFPEGVGGPFHQAIERAAATQQQLVFEQHFEPEDRWFENRAYPSAEGLSIYFTDITERKLAEQVLSDRAREFRELAEQMPALIYRAALDDSTQTLYMSSQVRELGLTPEQWLADPQSWSKTVHPDDRQRAVAALPSATSAHSEAQVVYRMRDAAGRWRHFRDSSRRVQPDDGGTPYLQGVSVDITDLVEAEQALQASESQLRASEQRYRLAAAGGLVWDWDAESGKAHIAPEFWTRLGQAPIDPESLIEQLDVLIHPDDRAGWKTAVRQHILQRQPFSVELRLRDGSGDWRWLHIQGQALWDDGGRVIYMAGTLADVTERKRAQAQLQASEAYRRQLFEQLADGVLLLDEQHRVRDANPMAGTLLGREHQALVGMSLLDLIAPQEQTRVDGLRKQPATRSEWSFVRADGSRFPAEVSVRAMATGHLLAVLRDISERRRADEVMMGYQLELSELTHLLLVQEKQASRRIAQALHDRVGQTLAVTRLHLSAALSAAADGLPAALADQYQGVDRLLGQAVQEVRDVLAELRPPLLEEQGLVAALDNEIATPAVGLAGVDVLLELDEGVSVQNWPPDVEYAAFMVAREAITNALLHGKPSLVRVVLGGSAHALRLAVVDDGVGIAAHMTAGRAGHLGLVGMRERALAVGAEFAVVAEAQGGTRVTLHWEAPQS